MQFNQLFQEIREESEELSWEGTFKDYLTMVTNNPKLARLSHDRICDMLRWAGISNSGSGTPNYHLFHDQLFGSGKTIQRLFQIFQAASQIPEERRRIILLMGPPGSGKSSLVNLLKRGLERYSRSDEGALYTIAGCPMQEEPLHLIPEHRRAEILKVYGLTIEGDLCPRCRHNLKVLYKGDVSKVKIKRLMLSESEGIGLGSFVATSPQGQNLDRLIGSIDLDNLTEDRIEGAAKAFRMDGELQAANRGIMEFIQIFRSDDKFLTVVLGVSQEQLIKLGSFGSVYADETLIAHSNEAEYNNFISNKESEALLDRLIMLKVPYTLQRSEEIKIYRKLLTDGHTSDVHVSPLALPVLATMAVISRMGIQRRSLGISKVTLREKLDMYDGKYISRKSKTYDPSIPYSNSNEGMTGLSPRFVINRLADAISQENLCLGPIASLQNLMDGLVERAGLSKEEREHLPSLLPEVITILKDLAVEEVQRAATARFEDLAQEQFMLYMRDVKMLFNPEKHSKSRIQPNDQILRRLEKAIYLPESQRESFRRNMHNMFEEISNAGRIPNYKDFPLINSAINKLLFPSTKDLAFTLTDNQTLPDQLKKRKVIQEALVSLYGYCELCSEDLLVFAAKTLNNRDVVTIKRGRLARK